MLLYHLYGLLTLFFLNASEVNLDDDEDPSVMVMSSANVQWGEVRRSKKPNRKYVGSPWTPEDKGKRPRTSTSQILHRVCKNKFQPVLALDPFERPNDVECLNFLGWYNRHASTFAP